MSVEEYADKLDLGLGRMEEDDTYVIPISNSEEYGRVFTRLDKLVDRNELELFDSDEPMEENYTLIVYHSTEDDFIVELIANFIDNQYSVEITKG